MRVVVVSSLLAVGFLVWAQHRKHEWLRAEFERRAAKVEALEDFAEPPIPDEENVAAGLRDVAARLKKHNEEAGRPDSVYDDDWPELVKIDPEWKAEGSREARKYLDSVAPIIDGLERVLERPGFRTLTDWSKGVDIEIAEVPHVQELGETVVGYLRFARNDAEIVRGCRLLLRMSERLEMPFLIGAMCGWTRAVLAVDALRQAPRFDAAMVRRALDPHLARCLPQSGPSATILKQQRAFYLAITRKWASGSSIRPEVDGEAWQPPTNKPDLYRDAFRYLEFAERILPLCGTTPTTAHRVAKSIGGRWPEDREPLGIDLMRTDTTALLLEYARLSATMRLARTALAVLEARQQSGDWPEVLPGPRLIDPLSGKPFSYERGLDEVRLFAASRWLEIDGGWEFAVEIGHAWSWPRRG